MKAYIYILFLVCTITYCGAKSNRKGITHGSQTSFVTESYGGNLPIQQNKPTTTATYKKTLSSTVSCTGNHCVDGEWKCKKGDSRNCYNVEHIIDLNGPEFKDHTECKNVAGNMIMSHGYWNQELGTYTKANYQVSVSEKTRVYGDTIMYNARESIRGCIYAKTGKREIEDDITINTTNDIILEMDEGILVIPAGANYTCVGCDMTTLECDDCMCEECFIISYVSNPTEIDGIVTYGMFIFIVFTVLFVGILLGIVVTYAIKTPREKYLQLNIDTKSSMPLDSLSV